MQTKEPAVLCAGLVLADILLEGLDSMPAHWEQTLAAQTAVLGTGGGAANSAKTFGRLGYKVDLLACVGEDAFGKLIKEGLQNDHVGCSTLKQRVDAPTGIAVGLVKKDGKRCFITVQGANQKLSPDDFSVIDRTPYDAILINGFFQFPQIEPDLPGILDRCRSKGMIVALDTASWDPSGRWFQALQCIVDRLDYLFLNDSQIMEMTKCATVDEGAMTLLGHGVQNVIAKMGAQGCIRFASGKAPLHMPTITLPVKDTTGAGDSFDAAYLAGVLNEWDEMKCARFANTVAGLNCCAMGATAGVPDYRTAIEMMDRFYADDGQGGNRQCRL